ncbi:MFS transporter [Dactylosporangium sp. CA-052675]|uniref:MFS transporter n=1 Tax=Dactylosporangium sp. CA-052675 TaxID=3239927 RepID=UPI003D911880
MFIGTMLTGAMMVFITQHLQIVDGLSPRSAGLWILPAAIATAASFQVSPLLARRVRQGRLIAGGLLLSAVGVALVVFIPADAGPLPIIGAFMVTNLGMGPMVTLATGIVLGSAPPERAGSAGALNEVSGEFGYALGIALLGSLGTAVYRALVDVPAGVPGGVAAGVRDNVTAASAAAGSLPGELGERVLVAARDASTSGLHVVAGVCAVVLVGLAAVSLRMLRHLPPLTSAPSADPAGDPKAPSADPAGDPKAPSADPAGDPKAPFADPVSDPKAPSAEPIDGDLITAQPRRTQSSQGAAAVPGGTTEDKAVRHRAKQDAALREAERR